jgi:hypothetical protein
MTQSGNSAIFFYVKRIGIAVDTALEKKLAPERIIQWVLELTKHNRREVKRIANGASLIVATY